MAQQQLASGLWLVQCAQQRYWGLGACEAIKQPLHQEPTLLLCLPAATPSIARVLRDGSGGVHLVAAGQFRYWYSATPALLRL